MGLYTYAAGSTISYALVTTSCSFVVPNKAKNCSHALKRTSGGGATRNTNRVQLILVRPPQQLVDEREARHYCRSQADASRSHPLTFSHQ
eukprot:6890721-Pyramimonas_sp.AAC.1